MAALKSSTTRPGQVTPASHSLDHIYKTLFSFWPGKITTWSTFCAWPPVCAVKRNRGERWLFRVHRNLMAASKRSQGRHEDRLRIRTAGPGGIGTENSHSLKQQTGEKEKKLFKHWTDCPERARSLLLGKGWGWKGKKLWETWSQDARSSRFRHKSLQVTSIPSDCLSPWIQQLLSWKPVPSKKNRQRFLFQRGKVLQIQAFRKMPRKMLVL